jgi:rare lipoprotein A
MVRRMWMPQPDLRPEPVLPRWAGWGGLGGALVLWLVMLAGCSTPPGHWGGAARKAPGLPAVVAKPGPAVPSERDGPPPAAEAPSVAELVAQPDPVPQVEPIRQGGPNKPYTVLGQSYEPLTRDVPVKERGVASWYGRKFHGRRTASGEVFNMYGLSAAHRTLPIPSYARVTEPRSGKSIVVRINDRGPFHGGRVMDLSYGAAVKLGVVARGSAEIEFERLTFEDIRTGAWRRDGDLDGAAREPAVAEAPVAAPVGPVAGAGVTAGVADAAVSAPVSVPGPLAVRKSPAGPTARAFTPFQRGFWVQLAALGQREGVERLHQRIAAELQALEPLLAVYHEAPYFKLQVGPYGSRDEALAAADQARAALSLSPLVIERR